MKKSWIIGIFLVLFAISPVVSAVTTNILVIAQSGDSINVTIKNHNNQSVVGSLVGTAGTNNRATFTYISNVGKFDFVISAYRNNVLVTTQTFGPYMAGSDLTIDLGIRVSNPVPITSTNISQDISNTTSYTNTTNITMNTTQTPPTTSPNTSSITSSTWYTNTTGSGVSDSLKSVLKWQYLVGLLVLIVIVYFFLIRKSKERNIAKNINVISLKDMIAREYASSSSERTKGSSKSYYDHGGGQESGIFLALISIIIDVLVLFGVFILASELLKDVENRMYWGIGIVIVGIIFKVVLERKQ